jgi:hypothetical protein
VIGTGAGYIDQFAPRLKTSKRRHRIRWSRSLLSSRDRASRCTRHIPG